MIIKELLSWAQKDLKKSKVSEPESSARVLLGDVLNMTRTEILAEPDKKIAKKQEEKFRKYIDQRKKHESVWHIIGRVPFWGMELYISNDVLIPRPETEILIEKVVTEIMTRKYKADGMLDIGTGSGAIAIALANEFPEIKITASDVSEKALKIAEKNAKHNVAPNIKFTKSDLFSNIKDKFDIITANLPYIPSKEMGSLAMDVHHYEPRLALDGGGEGLEIYRRFLKEVGNYLNKNGIIFCEIGHDQGNLFKMMSKKYLPEFKCEVIKDFADIDRIVIIKKVNIKKD